MNIEVENIDHIGIIAGIIDEIGIVEIIHPTFRIFQTITEILQDLYV